MKPSMWKIISFSALSFNANVISQALKYMTPHEIELARQQAARFAADEAARIEKARADAARFAEETARRIEENRKLAESFRKK